MRRAAKIVAAIAALLILADAWLRLAPVDVARWHADIGAPGYAPPANAAVFCTRPGGRDAPDLTDPAALLAALDTIALATPRTQRLAGSPEDGRITWITRSRLMGYPDFTTAAILGGAGNARRFCVIARQGFGRYDWGVNAARLGGWMQALLGLPEPPEPGAF
jgi:hypothetical protein